MSELVSALKGTEFFEGFSDQHLKRVAAISEQVEFPAHHTIFHEDERAKEVFVVLSGRVSLIYCAPRVGCRQLMEVGPGELIGWSALVGRARLSDSELQKREAEANAANAAKTDIGWGHQIRSYVLQPYQLVKDLRTGVTSTSPSDVLDGDLDRFMAAALSQRVTGETVEVEDVE